jgi:hypothetical protein
MKLNKKQIRKQLKREVAYLRFEKKVFDQFNNKYDDNFDNFTIQNAIKWAFDYNFHCQRWADTFEERHPEYFL